MASKIVLISGCSSGIGLATAVLLAKDPEKRFKVYATMRNLAKKGQLEEEGKEYLGNTLIIKQMDVSSTESVNKAVLEVLDAEGQIDVLFNNAGLALSAVVECAPIDMVKELFEVNFFGALRLTQAVLPSMKARKSGHIIQNSSVFGIAGAPFFELYCASKFALEGLTESLAPSLLHFNIRSSLLEPGPVKTELLGTADTWTKKYKTPTPDQLTLELQKSFNEKFLSIFQRTIQTADEVAERVKDIILSEKPNLRYPTNDKFSPEEEKAKLSDRTGNEIVEILNKKYLSKE